MKTKILFTSFTIIMAIIFYLLVFPKFVVKTLETEKNIPLKILPYRDYSDQKKDSVLVYLPYKIKITNYSLSVLKKPNYYFKTVVYEHHPYFLMYEKNGINTDALNGKYVKLYPFIPKTFYVYKYNVVSAKRLKLTLDSITCRKLEWDFSGKIDSMFTKESYDIPRKIVDSLRSIEDKKYMHFGFASQPLWWLKFRPSDNVNFFRNLSGLSKEELYKEFTKQVD